jgi:hypothetical protein
MLRVVAGARVMASEFSVMRVEPAGSVTTALAALSTGESVRLSPMTAPAGSSVRLAASGFAATPYSLYR